MRSAFRLAVALTALTGFMLTVVSCTSAASDSSPKTSSTDTSSPNASSSAATSPEANGVTPPGPAASPLPPATITIHAPGYAGLGELAVGPDAVWLGDGPFRIDPRHHTIGKALSVQPATDMGAAGSNLWVSDYGNGVVRRYDANTGKLVATVHLPDVTPEGIAITDTAVWVASHHGGNLDRIDPATNKVVSRGPRYESRQRRRPVLPQPDSAASGSGWATTTPSSASSPDRTGFSQRSHSTTRWCLAAGSRQATARSGSPSAWTAITSDASIREQTP